jgi:hypothetical protein
MMNCIESPPFPSIQLVLNNSMFPQAEISKSIESVLHAK